jgi:2,4-dienoyl-CoA reductase-like NADH-dependent reductase (Old Yellow Enzyme family)
MDEHDIARVIRQYADAAERCKDGGLDGIETLGGGHMMGQFLSPAMNQRTDRWGGSIENRCRFGFMVLDEIRRQAATTCRRHAMRSTGNEAGSAREGIDIARLFEMPAARLFNAIYGGITPARVA